MSTRCIYKGYTVDDVTTPTDDGRFRARVAIMSLDGDRTRSQRFLDLETFQTREEAYERTVRVAMAWIDELPNADPLALPTNFSPLI